MTVCKRRVFIAHTCSCICYTQSLDLVAQVAYTFANTRFHTCKNVQRA